MFLPGSIITFPKHTNITIFSTNLVELVNHSFDIVLIKNFKNGNYNTIFIGQYNDENISIKWPNNRKDELIIKNNIGLNEYLATTIF